MNLYGCYFTYAGTSSTSYLTGAPNLIISNVETNPNYALTGDVSDTSTFHKVGVKDYFSGYAYGKSSVSFDIEITTEDGEVLTNAQSRAIEKWLFFKNTFCKLYPDHTYDSATDPEYYTTINGVNKYFYLNCILTEPERIEGNGGTVGYRCTLINDSCMLWQDLVKVTQNISSTASRTFTVTVDTDINEYTYPKVYLTIGSSGGNITINNTTEDGITGSTRTTGFTGLTANTSFYMDGQLNFISGENFQKFSDKHFLRLMDGNNTINVTGNVTKIEIEWNNRRYL